MDTHTPPTLWEVPDDVWTLIAPLRNACYSAKPMGHRRVDRRPVLHGLIFRRRTGGPWHQRPKPYGDDSPVPRHCQPWAHAASGPAGGPRGATSAGANVHDPTWLAATLVAMGVERPQPTAARSPPFCLDQGDDHPTGHETVAA